MKCENCGAETNSKFCESCGSPMEQNQTQAQSSPQQNTAAYGYAQANPKKPIFKRWWFWLIIVVAIGAIVFGSSNNNPSKEANGNNSAQSTSVDETFALNETAVFEDLKITANELKESNGSSFNNPDDGYVYVGVNFTVENISDEDQAMSSILLFDAYIDGVKCDYSIGAAVDFDGTIDGTISPNKKLVGWYSVEVPEDWKELELQVKSSWLDSSKATFVFNK